MNQDFWLSFWFLANLLWSLVEASCGIIWMASLNAFVAIYMLDIILDIDAMGLEGLNE